MTSAKSLQVSIVGDFTDEEVEDCIIDYLGTISPTKANIELELKERPLAIQPPAKPELRHQKVKSLSKLRI